MSEQTMKLYEGLVLRRPWVTLTLLLLLVALAASQTPKIKLDASADSLMLQGDPSLEFFREVGRDYAAEDFVLITWQPRGALLADESLDALDSLAAELRGIEGVSSVVTALDVPLLESPPVSLSDITSPDPLPSLRDPGIDRELVLKELTTSPIYADLLASRDGQLSAVQINLQRDERYFTLLSEREALRKSARNGELDANGRAALVTSETAFKAHTAIALERQSQLVSSVRAVAARYTDDAQLFVGGVPMIAADMVSFVRSDLVTFGSAILGIMLVVLALIFRRVRWVVIPLVTCSATVVIMLGLLGFLDWRMTVISSNFVAVLLIITLAVAIHLVVRYRELHALEPEGDLYLRVRETVRLMSVPCVYTGVTTIVAFMSLLVSGLQPVIDFGLMMTVGILVALLVAFTAVPCLMLVWPQGQPFRYDAQGEPITVAFASLTDHHRGLILAASGLLVLGTIIGLARLQVENRFIDYFHEETEIYQGMELLDSQLGGTIPLDIVLSPPDADLPLPGLEPLAESSANNAAPLDELGDDFANESDSFDEFDDDFGDDFGGGFDEFGSEPGFEPSFWFSLEGMRLLDAAHAHIDAQPETGKVLSLSTVFAVVKNLLGDDIGGVELALVQKSLPEDIKGMMVAPYFNEDKQQARLTVRVMETSETLRRDAFLEKLHRELIEVVGLAPEQVQFTGMLVMYNNVLQSLFRSQILTLGAVFLAILVMFMGLFRSFWLSLLTLAPNVLAAGLVLGIMGLVGIPLDIMTITIAAIVVGIGVDDCIHYVHRFKKEFARDRDYTAAMYRSHRSIGRAMYYTTVTIVIGFLTLTLSNFNPSIYFGLLTVVAMIAAVLGALLLLPGLIILFKPLGPEGEPTP
ncbi:MAG: MMPL family transporter [Pseudomonadota bacterium]